MAKKMTVLLWPDAAPGAMGDDVADKPDLTLYLPAGNGPFSCVLICPGGGYSCKAPHEGEPIALWLNSIGIAGAVVQYRVSPYRHPIPADDARRGIRMLRAKASEWGLDPAHVGILGFSAGGHCASTAATIFTASNLRDGDPIDRESSRPDALIACYPVISFGDKRHDGSMRNLLKDAKEQVDPAMQNYLSLEKRVTAQTPPTFLWHTADDGSVPVENCLLFAAALRANKVPFALHVFPHGAHGLGLASNNSEVGQWPALCGNWLKSIGF
jgi:acetyl esterase/lipase